MLAQALCVAALVAVHVFAGRLRFLGGTPRSRWLSFAGGLSVGYVFVHLFPELEQAQAGLEEHLEMEWLGHHAYVVALAGLVAFYGVERLVSTNRHRRDERGPGAARDGATAALDEAGADLGDGVFWTHVATFAAYNALIGYLLVHRVDASAADLLWYTIAMALHFVVNDHGLAEDHQGVYRRVGRWALVAAILVGWTVGLVTEVGEATVHVLFALLAGGIVLNVLKEELPEQRESRFVPFVGGAALYTLLAQLD